MSFSVLALATLLLTIVGSAALQTDPDCPAKYKDIDDYHTMCLIDSTDAEAITLTQEEKDAVLNKHNNFRSDVDPTATNLIKVAWDDDIAEVAAKWARQCVRGHDSGGNRSVPEVPGVYMGQNAAFGYSSFVNAVVGWHSEVDNFKYGSGAINVSKDIGHYTQIVNFRVLRIGCGSANCDNVRFDICNYASGQLTNDMTAPYESGASASQCAAANRDNNLCDCGGIVCKNGGTFNIATCSCSCPALFSGNECQDQVNCPNTEDGMCAVFQTNWCSQSWYKFDKCPYTCGVCDKPSSCQLNCKNGSKYQKSPCDCVCASSFYSGDECETLTCPSSDPSYCSSNDSGHCTKYWNWKFLCPHTCGTC